ncbi:hypothetical protein SFUMM280S_07078 [Streptomyces fumanus]
MTCGWSCTGSPTPSRWAWRTGCRCARPSPGRVSPPGCCSDFFMDRFAAAYRAELTAFTEVVAGVRPSPCPIEEALEAGWIAEACALSLREHRPVPVAEVRRA